MWKTLAISAGLVAAASAASAQPQCNDRAHVLDLLAKNYKEAPIAAGVTNSGGLVEVLSDGKGGTWTIIVTTPQGTTCLIAAGEGWRTREQVALDPGA